MKVISRHRLDFELRKKGTGRHVAGCSGGTYISILDGLQYCTYTNGYTHVCNRFTCSQFSNGFMQLNDTCLNNYDRSTPTPLACLDSWAYFPSCQT